jgi:hypothetical protein
MYIKDWPDVKVRLTNVIEAGDLVAYQIECQEKRSLWAFCNMG